MQELFLSDEFRRYRKAQIMQIIDHVRPMVLSPDGTNELKGALDMARKLIKLPGTFKLAKEIKERIKDEAHQDMKEFEVKFVRSHLIDDDSR